VISVIRMFGIERRATEGQRFDGEVILVGRGDKKGAGG
jgi:hypothetical protein